MSLFDIYQKLKKNSNMDEQEEEEEEKTFMYIDSRETDSVSTTHCVNNKQSKCFGICSDGTLCNNFSSHNGLCYVHKDQKIAYFNT
tara:strand:+ start:85 stop:342 length:258 start_codon:yes stop_codon:yes gene_type:complete